MKTARASPQQPREVGCTCPVGRIIYCTMEGRTPINLTQINGDATVILLLLMRSYACSFQRAVDAARAGADSEAAVEQHVKDAQSAVHAVLEIARASVTAAVTAGAGGTLDPHSGAGWTPNGGAVLRQRLQALASSPLESVSQVRMAVFHD